MRNIEKTDNSKTWQFFQNLRNFENLLILKFDNSKFFWNFDNSENYKIFIFKIFFLNLQTYKIY